ncbi:MAG: 50S ribosomal protein L29 [Anaerolineae bacterium]|nr:MAG: 50S ribosomal protein L29 [Anaerolineae bacterium]
MKVQEILDMNDEQLAEALRAAREEQMRLRFQATTGELKDTSRLTFVRKNIARLQTIARQRALAGEKEGK